MVADTSDGQLCGVMLYRIARHEFALEDVWGSPAGVDNLIAKMVEKTRVSHLSRSVAVVSECDEETLSVLRRHGFKGVRVVRQRFGRNDGILMEVSKEMICQA